MAKDEAGLHELDWVGVQSAFPSCISFLEWTYDLDGVLVQGGGLEPYLGGWHRLERVGRIKLVWDRGKAGKESGTSTHDADAVGRSCRNKKLLELWQMRPVPPPKRVSKSYRPAESLTSAVYLTRIAAALEGRSAASGDSTIYAFVLFEQTQINVASSTAHKTWPSFFFFSLEGGGGGLFERFLSGRVEGRETSNTTKVECGAALLLLSLRASSFFPLVKTYVLLEFSFGAVQKQHEAIAWAMAVGRAKKSRVMGWRMCRCRLLAGGWRCSSLGSGRVNQNKEPATGSSKRRKQDQKTSLSSSNQTRQRTTCSRSWGSLGVVNRKLQVQPPRDADRQEDELGRQEVEAADLELGGRNVRDGCKPESSLDSASR